MDEITEQEVVEGGETKPDEDEVESLAKEMGWNPDHEGEEFVEAKEYIKKGQDIQDSMRKSLKDQRRQISDMSGSIEDLKIHNERVYKADISRLEKDLVTLRAEKKEAIEDGNVEKVTEIDEKIDAARESITPVEEKTEINPEFEDWLKDNKWYADDKEMADYADSIAVENKGLSFKRKAALAKKKVKEAFPEKFTAINPVDRVEGVTRRKTTANFTEANLTSDQKSIMNQFVKQGILTKKQYIEDLAKVAGSTG